MEHLGVFIAIAVVVVIVLVQRWYEANLSKTWRAFADRTGLTYAQHGRTHVLHGVYQDTEVRISTEYRGHGRGKKRHTVFEAYLEDDSLPRGLRIVREGWLEKAAKAVGGQDIEVGDTLFDDVARITCEDEEAARRLLGDERVSQALYAFFKRYWYAAIDTVTVRVELDHVADTEQMLFEVIDDVVDVFEVLKASAEGRLDELDASRPTSEPTPWEPDEDVRDSVMSWVGDDEGEDDHRVLIHEQVEEQDQLTGAEGFETTPEVTAALLGLDGAPTLTPPSTAELISVPTAGAATSDEPASGGAAVEIAERPTGDDAAESGEPAGGGAAVELDPLRDELRDRSLDADARAKLLAEAASELGVASLDLVVDRVGWTVGFDIDDALQGGRTLEATVAGSGHPVMVRFPEARNDEIDELSSGARLACEARLSGWDDLFERLRFDAV